MVVVKVQGRPLKVLLVGKVGAGKSSTANSILLSNKAKFKTGADSVSVTQTPQKEYGRVKGRGVEVVDVPGLADSQKNDEDAIRNLTKQIKSVMKLNPDGFDAILIVVPCRRLSIVDVKVVEQLKIIFGKNFISDYGVLLITRSGDFDPQETDANTIEEWCSKQQGLLKELKQECRNRVVFFENKHSKTKEKNIQVEQLLQIVEKMRYGSKRYTPGDFKASQKERERLLLKAKTPQLWKEFNWKNNVVNEKLDRIKLKNPEKDIPVLRDILRSVQTFLQEIKEEDRGFGELNGMIDTLVSKEKLIQDKLCRAKNDLEYIKKERESKKKISTMKEDHAADVKRVTKDISNKNQQLYTMEKEHKASIASANENIRKAKAKNRMLKIKMALKIGAAILMVGGAVVFFVKLLPAVGLTACLVLGYVEEGLSLASVVLDTVCDLFELF